MPLHQIPKKTKGEFRQIYAPTKKEKRRFRVLLPELNQIAIDNCSGCVHGFMPGKSPVTNAREHIGYQYTLSFDLKDFFDSVKPEMIMDYFDGPWISPSGETHRKTNDYFIQGRAYQGLPTSPQIANLAAVKMDEDILNNCDIKMQVAVDKNGEKCERIRYSRYADDLSFSFYNYDIYQELLNLIPNLVAKHGFTINPAKTRLQSAKFGNRVITGVSVGETGISVPRRIKRRVKLAKYQKDEKTLKGLTEWSKLKLPHFPISHTLKVIDNIVSYLKVTAVVNNKVAPHIDLSKIGRRFGRGKRYVQQVLNHFKKFHGVTPEVITKISKVTK